MRVFSEMSARLDSDWRAVNYSTAAFPEIAARALRDANLPELISPWDVVDWVGSEPQLPRQQDIEASFGNPPITLYCGSRFYIDAYFWLDGTTDIHQHSFAGAFQVLRGSSIHSRYSFRTDQEINQHLIIGGVKFETVELLQQGEIRQIIPGQDHIHALFHLDRPSVTITVRTFALPAHQPQYSYLKPYFAIDPFYKEQALARKLQTVAMLLHLQQPERDKFICDLVANSDFHSTFLVLRTASQYLSGSELERQFQLSRSRDRFDQMLAAARRRHGELVDYLTPVLKGFERTEMIARRRQFITTPEHRFFLALILNLNDRARLLEMVQGRFPADDPIERVLDWVTELAATKAWGSTEPNVLGISGFADDHVFVLECLLREYSPEQVNRAMEKQYPRDYAHQLEEKFDTIAATLRESMMFGSWLA
jgi:hypothetical protein